MPELKPPEHKRTYHYADGFTLTFYNVTMVEVTKSGFHKIESDDGKFIVAPGWRWIALDVDAWTF